MVVLTADVFQLYKKNMKKKPGGGQPTGAVQSATPPTFGLLGGLVEGSRVRRGRQGRLNRSILLCVHRSSFVPL